MSTQTELALKAMVRLGAEAALAAEIIRKYSSTQPRDGNGRWTTGGGGSFGSLGESVKPGAGDIAAMRKSSITSQHLDADGNFTPERQAFHDQVVEEHLRGVKPASGQPVQYMNGGGPGSGKSSLRVGDNARITHYPPTREVNENTGEMDFAGEPNPGAVLIDPDGMKMMLPEVKARRAAGDTTWAGASHEESSYLAKRVHQAALDRGLTLVYDGTGDSGIEGVTKKVGQARKKGYRVEANYIFLEPSEGIRRAATRGERIGRIVPHAQIVHTYGDVPNTFKAAAEGGTFDAIRLFDNNAGGGAGAKLIATSDSGSFQVSDPDAYGRFLAGGAR